MPALVSLDIESYRFTPTAVLPRAVCVTLAGASRGKVEACLVSNGDGDEFFRTFDGCLDDVIAGSVELVGHNLAGFDLPDVYANFPGMISKIFRALETGRVRDTMIREKLLNLADHGQVDKLFLPDGSSRDISYRLEDLVSKHLGFDRAAAKDKNAEDRWQLNFDQLDGIPSEKYPPDAADYAKTDAVDAYLVKEAQDRVAAEKFRGAIGHDGKPFDVFLTEQLHVGVAFCLTLMTAIGFRIDQDEVKKIKARIEKELTPERAKILIDAGIITPALPARPYKNGAVNKDGTPKMVPPEPEHTKKAPLQKLVESTCREHNLPIKLTESSSRFPEGQTSCNADVIESLAGFSPVLVEYEHRQNLKKMVDDILPRLETFKADKTPEETRIVVQTVHPNYDILKRSARVSSFAGKHYPSCNIQNVPRSFDLQDGTKIEPRGCYMPRTPGWLLCSVDYATLELCTFAQKCIDVFGRSVLAEVINSGKDSHAYYGAQIAYELDNDFYQFCKAVLPPGLDRSLIYGVFYGLRHGADDEKKFYKKFRGMAKVAALAFPGGMGAETLIAYARATYGVRIESIDLAKRLKAIWGEVYPEGPAWLRWAPDQYKDTVNSTTEEPKMAYFTKLGMYRAGCDFCALVNGAALQSNAAEGGKIAIWDVTRACYDPALKSMLYGCHVLAFVHDELLIELPNDEWAHHRSFEVSRIMVGSMKVICPDLEIKAEPALMEHRWNKGAEAVYDLKDMLQPWRPGVKYKADASGRLRVPS